MKSEFKKVMELGIENAKADIALLKKEITGDIKQLDHDNAIRFVINLKRIEITKMKEAIRAYEGK